MRMNFRPKVLDINYAHEFRTKSFGHGLHTSSPAHRTSHAVDYHMAENSYRVEVMPAREPSNAILWPILHKALVAVLLAVVLGLNLLGWRQKLVCLNLVKLFQRYWARCILPWSNLVHGGDPVPSYANHIWSANLVCSCYARKHICCWPMLCKENICKPT